MVHERPPKSQLSPRIYGVDPCYHGVQCSSAINHMNNIVSADHRQLHHPQQQIMVSNKPKLPSPPCQVVIGFCLVAENKHGDACESPRSVLEPNALSGRGGGMAKVASQEKQARSPRSALEGRLSGSRSPWDKKGVGLAIVAAMKAEEEEEVGGEERTKGHDAAVGALTVKLLSPSVQQSPPVRSQPIPIAQPGPWPWKQKKHNKKEIEGERESLDDEAGEEEWEEENQAALSWRNRSTREHISSPILNVREQKVALQSIFSTASPVSSFGSEGLYLSEVDFLHACFFCKRVLVQGKDIYMYRGDRAFCSPECRYRQIVLDEGKERGPVSANCYAGASSHRCSVLSTPTAAAA